MERPSAPSSSYDPDDEMETWERPAERLVTPPMGGSRGFEWTAAEEITALAPLSRPGVRPAGRSTIARRPAPPSQAEPPPEQPRERFAFDAGSASGVCEHAPVAARCELSPPPLFGPCAPPRSTSKLDLGDGRGDGAGAEGQETSASSPPSPGDTSVSTWTVSMPPDATVPNRELASTSIRPPRVTGSLFTAVAAIVTLATMIGALLLSVRAGGSPVAQPLATGRGGVAAAEPLPAAPLAAPDTEVALADTRNANARIDQAVVAGPKNVDNVSPPKSDSPKPGTTTKKVRPRIEAKKSIAKTNEKVLAELQLEQLGR